MNRSHDPDERELPDGQEHQEDAHVEEAEIDQILADSFPASDAPPWTLGVSDTPPTAARTRKRRNR